MSKQLSKAEELLVKHGLFFSDINTSSLYKAIESAMKEAVSDAFDAGTMSILRSDTNGIQYRKDQFIKDYFGESEGKILK